MSFTSLRESIVELDFQGQDVDLWDRLDLDEESPALIDQIRVTNGISRLRSTASVSSSSEFGGALEGAPGTTAVMAKFVTCNIMQHCLCQQTLQVTT